MSLSLKDRLELHQLPVRYRNIVEQKFWRRLGKIFTHDASISFSEADEIVGGLDNIMAHLRDRKCQPDHYHILNTFVDQHGDDARVYTRLIFPASPDTEHSIGWPIGIGLFIDEATKEEGEWRLRRRTFKRV